MIKLKVGNVVYSSNTYTGGKAMYLVIFTDPSEDYFTGIRVSGNDRYFTGHEIVIPLADDSSGYCNIFTGIKSVAKNSVDSIINTLTTEDYTRIIDSVYSVMKGEYTRDQQGRLMVSTVVEDSIEDEMMKKLDNHDDTLSSILTGISEIKELIKSTTKNETKKNMQNNVVKEVELLPTEDGYKYFDRFRTPEERMDWIFEEFGENGRINFAEVYSSLVTCGKSDKRSDSLNLTREEFDIIISKNNNLAMEHEFTSFDGKVYKFTITNLRSFKVKARRIYLGKKDTQKKNIKDKKIDVANVTDITSKILSNDNIISANKKGVDTLSIIKACNYINRHQEVVNEISLGSIDDDFDGNKDMIRAIAIKIVNPKTFATEISTVIPDFIINTDIQTLMIIFPGLVKSTVIKMLKIAFLYQNKDKYDWSMAPKDIYQSKDIYSNTLFDCLSNIVKDVEDVDTFLKNSYSVQLLKDRIGIPASYFRYSYDNLISQ